MRIKTALASILLAALSVHAQEEPMVKQTKVNMSSHSFNDGVHTTFTVDFPDIEAKVVEGYWKKQLKDMCEDLETKKHLTAIGTRIPQIHTDTIRVLGEALQYKKSETSTMHLAFIVDRKDVGTSTGEAEETRIQACKDFVYQRSVELKRQIITEELEEANKELSKLEKSYDMLVKEKERAEKSIEKNHDKGKDAEKEKAKAKSELKSLESQIKIKQEEIATNPSEDNTEALNEMLGDREKATSRRDKAEKTIINSDKKVKDLEHQVKKNIEEQGRTKQAIEKAKELVEQITEKLSKLS